MKVTLKEIKISRFKAIKDMDIVLDGKNAVISGANGSGKTSIYEAYYWCLFGKTLAPNGIVQTLDENNEIVHKVDTVVELTLNVDDDYDVKIRRALVEKWKAANTPDEVFMGTETQRYWNDVPVSMAEYKRKLGNIVSIAQWQLLSNNFAFMGYKMEDRRKMLMSVAGEINEAKLMEPYPAIQQAVHDRKSINELNIQTKRTRKDANKELTQIPAKISAQDALKTNTSGSDDDAAAVEKYFADLKNAQDKADNYRRDWEKRCNDNISDLQRNIFDAQTKMKKATDELLNAQDEQDRRIKKLANVTEDFSNAKEKWQKVNDTQFDFKQSDICPVCKQKLPEAFKRDEYANAVKEFNSHKSDRLAEIMKEAQQLAEQRNVLQGAIKTFNEITKPKLEKVAKLYTDAVKAAEKGLEVAKSAKLEDVSEYADLLKAVETLQAEKPENADDIVKLKADQEINKRVEAEKERLQKRSKELTQIIADCDNVLSQIFNYKKAKIDAVEDKVNGVFSLVRWKFFQQNITNDDLQEICTCIVDGVDYNNLNTASRVNASVDIINGISKAANIHVPCFFDNRESVTELLKSDSQQISLKVVDNAPLEVKTI